MRQFLPLLQLFGVTGGFGDGGFKVGGPPPGFIPTPPTVGIPAGFTGVFGGTKGGVPTVGLTTEVTGEVGEVEEVFFGSPVILSMTAFVVAPKAAPVKAVPNLLVVPVDFVTTGFAVGVTDVLVAGVVGVLDIAGFVAAVVFDVSAGFAAIAGLAAVLAVVTGFVAVVFVVREGLAPVAAGFIPIGFDVMPARGPPMLVRGASASAVVDVTPPRDGNLPAPPKEGAPSP